MNFRPGAQSWESPLRLTPQFGKHKSQTPVSCSVVYKKTPGPFKMGKEREKKLCWQKTERRHYELAMSDELFKDTNGPGATWFIDCSKSANLFLSPLFTVCHPEKNLRGKTFRLWVDTCWFTTCWGLRSAAAKGKVTVGDIMESIVNN